MQHLSSAKTAVQPNVRVGSSMTLFRWCYGKDGALDEWRGIKGSMTVAGGACNEDRHDMFIHLTDIHLDPYYDPGWMFEVAIPFFLKNRCPP